MILPPPHADGSPRRLLNIFAGSGGEALGGMRAGWEEIVGIERDEHFADIAEARLRRWSEVPLDVDPFESKPPKPNPAQVDLFAKKAG